MIAAIVFFVQSKNFALGKGLSTGITVSLSAWALIRLFVRYTLEFNGLALVSENVFDIFALCAIMMALLYIAHLYAGMTPKKSEPRLFFFGLIAALFSVITSISRIILIAANNQNALTHSANPSFANLFISLYIIVLLFYMTSKNTVNDAALFTEDEDDGDDEYKPQFGGFLNGESTDNGESKAFSDDEAENVSQNTDDGIAENTDESTDQDSSSDAFNDVAEPDAKSEPDSVERAAAESAAEREEKQTEGQAEREKSQNFSEKGPSFDDFSIDSILAEIEKREREAN